MPLKTLCAIAAIVAVAVGTAAAAAQDVVEPDVDGLFETWRVEHGKHYTTVEEHFARKAIFAANLEKINAHNALNLSWRMSANAFADLTHEEFKARYVGGFRGRVQPHEMDLSLLSVNATELPATVDWVAKGAVTGVKNQQQCGGCWAFSTTGSVEGITFIKTGKLISLSEQQLLDCSKAEGNSGCAGGLMDDAFKYIIAHGGICSEAAYPYKAADGTCHASSCKSVASITGYKDVPHQNADALKGAVAQQPVSIAIEADQDGFQFYSGGVFSGACGTNLDHGVLAVGYGADYWLVKNSWGTSWGEKGYIQLDNRPALNNGAGQCGILLAPSYPEK